MAGTRKPRNERTLLPEPPAPYGVGASEGAASDVVWSRCQRRRRKRRASPASLHTPPLEATTGGRGSCAAAAASAGAATGPGPPGGVRARASFCSVLSRLICVLTRPADRPCAACQQPAACQRAPCWAGGAAVAPGRRDANCAARAAPNASSEGAQAREHGSAGPTAARPSADGVPPGWCV